ncbi:MAG TPA: NAD(P)/FAD-dependent oxidoreductase [Burkholderiaceae bacterium]|nr:NAD(P)/FAD-dependent oxidoreductase [Burkholderiaceae bacterium]
MERVEAIVVGAGVVGLAVARSLALRGLETVVLEGEPLIGSGTSSRNSEVIHAGIYYPEGSWKARLCVEGKQRLYVYCAERGIDHRRCGKLIVATSQVQLPALRRLMEQGRANGVLDLEWLEASQARAWEPALACVAAVWSPSTGIVDSHGLMLALQGDVEAAGGAVALASPVLGLACGRDGFVVQVGGDAPMELGARVLVNAAGLAACDLAAGMTGWPRQLAPRPRYAKGNYYSLARKAPFSRLIYPIPEAAGLGVHLTLDLAGQARFGPDVEWVEPDAQGRLDYRVDPGRANRFYDEIRRYWPELPADSLQPAYSGIRPKIHGPGEPTADFMILGPDDHGVPGLVQLFGIESPGLTASLALGDLAARLALGVPGSRPT